MKPPLRVPQRGNGYQPRQRRRSHGGGGVVRWYLLAESQPHSGETLNQHESGLQPEIILQRST
jgi:hypothetical protein